MNIGFIGLRTYVTWLTRLASWAQGQARHLRSQRSDWCLGRGYQQPPYSRGHPATGRPAQQPAHRFRRRSAWLRRAEAPCGQRRDACRTGTLPRQHETNHGHRRCRQDNAPKGHMVRAQATLRTRNPQVLRETVTNTFIPLSPFRFRGIIICSNLALRAPHSTSTQPSECLHCRS